MAGSLLLTWHYPRVRVARKWASTATRGGKSDEDAGPDSGERSKGDDDGEKGPQTEKASERRTPTHTKIFPRCIDTAINYVMYTGYFWPSFPPILCLCRTLLLPIQRYSALSALPSHI